MFMTAEKRQIGLLHVTRQQQVGLGICWKIAMSKGGSRGFSLSTALWYCSHGTCCPASMVCLLAFRLPGCCQASTTSNGCKPLFSLCAAERLPGRRPVSERCSVCLPAQWPPAGCHTSTKANGCSRVERIARRTACGLDMNSSRTLSASMRLRCGTSTSCATTRPPLIAAHQAAADQAASPVIGKAGAPLAHNTTSQVPPHMYNMS